MKPSELFARMLELTGIEPSAAAVRCLHETLVLACAEALRDTQQAYGNLFAQVDYLCKRYSISMRDRIAIQLMRRHSNGGSMLTADDWQYDLRALAIFISAVFRVPMPAQLKELLPEKGRVIAPSSAVRRHSLRCIVTGWDDKQVYATSNDGPVTVVTNDSRLPSILVEGMQLNLLDCQCDGTMVTPGLIVVEPDYLMDISAIAACFQEYGHHPYSHLFNTLKPRPNTQAILLGNFAGTALDDLINQSDFQFADTLRTSFREQALQFCTCADFDATRFKEDALRQVSNIREAVELLFATYDRSHALIEPSFVCEQLGLQGRVDLMTDDMRLLVEQKSGKNWTIESQPAKVDTPPDGGHLYKEDHYVQLLLYYGVLHYNFHLPTDQVDIRLLYSRYPACQGLVVANYYQRLFREAIMLRNRIVALQLRIARQGFGPVLSLLRPNLLLENPKKGEFFLRYIRPRVEQLLQPLQQLSAVERDYVERMLTFVYRELLAQKVGVQEGQGGAAADLWNMPLAEKMETGNILLGDIYDKTPDAITLAIDTDQVLPNFRRGDMVYLYRYDGQPDVRANILYKGTVERLTDSVVTVRLNERQQNAHIFRRGSYAVEHAPSDLGAASAVRAIYAFCSADPDRRSLLLGQRPPRRDPSKTLSRSYHPHYDDILLKACQASDYFLLQGPPGTGKTSMALRFLVEEELGSSASTPHSARDTSFPSLLLTAYTNRAVDEICAMLTDAGLDFLRVGSASSCDPRFVPRLLDHLMEERPKLSAIRQRLLDTRIVVGTTSTLQARPFLLQLMRFSLCIVDEASQILEPNIIGLLSSARIGRFILIGDHKQLPAVVQQPDDEPRLHSCRQSLFERLLRIERQAGRTNFVGLLNRQGRMHPDIAQFPDEFFYAREHLQPVPCPHQEVTQLEYHQPSEDALDDMLKEHRILFIDSRQPQPAVASDKANAAEAVIVADLLRRIHRQYGAHFDAARTVGVIVPYRNQIAMIRRQLERIGIPQLLDISIDTVERYQGSQRDVIIYSFTVQRSYQLDFLTANCFEEDGRTIDRKLNVAMTRARCQLLMTGNAEILRQNTLFAELIRRYGITKD